MWLKGYKKPAQKYCKIKTYKNQLLKFCAVDSYDLNMDRKWTKRWHDEMCIILAQTRGKPWISGYLQYEVLRNLAPSTGLEPVTYGLTVRRSTDWTTREWADNPTHMVVSGQDKNKRKITLCWKVHRNGEYIYNVQLYSFCWVGIVSQQYGNILWCC